MLEPAFAPRVERLEVAAYTVPTETPEADGTLSWNETTLVLVRVEACAVAGLGYSFADVATAFADFGVSWFEEPVSSDDLEGLRLVREHTPPGMRIAAGEYGYDSFYFRRMLEAGAVDVLQADATRCAGITGFITAGNLCSAFATPFSAHTAPSLHAHAACAAPSAINVEYFFDHYRIEQMFFDGALKPSGGMLRPDSSHPGFGLECKLPDMEKYRVYGNAKG